MQKVPDWTIQTIWFLAGICATGALWYFLSNKVYLGVISAGVGAIIFAILAIILHRYNDKENKRGNTQEKEFTFRFKEEKVTVTELVRSLAYDIVRVNANTYFLGVLAEYKWLENRYPKCKAKSQSLINWDINKSQKGNKDFTVFFDVVDITLKDGRNKKIYFDISRFFTGSSKSLDPSSNAAEKINELYK